MKTTRKKRNTNNQSMEEIVTILFNERTIRI
jgi:hypothetical protein